MREKQQPRSALVGLWQCFFLEAVDTDFSWIKRGTQRARPLRWSFSNFQQTHMAEVWVVKFSWDLLLRARRRRRDRPHKKDYTRWITDMWQEHVRMVVIRQTGSWERNFNFTFWFFAFATLCHPTCALCRIGEFLSDPGIPGVRSMGPSSGFWPNFRILAKFQDLTNFQDLTKFQDFNQISGFQSNIRILTKFQDFNQISGF